MPPCCCQVCPQLLTGCPCLPKRHQHAGDDTESSLVKKLGQSGAYKGEAGPQLDSVHVPALRGQQRVPPPGKVVWGGHSPKATGYARRQRTELSSQASSPAEQPFAPALLAKFSLGGLGPIAEDSAQSSRFWHHCALTHLRKAIISGVGLQTQTNTARTCQQSQVSKLTRNALYSTRSVNVVP